MSDLIPAERPEPPRNDKLSDFWDQEVWKLASMPPVQVSPCQQERHQIYLRLLMAMINDYWNTFKNGRDGKYPWSREQSKTHPYEYKGHNIAALAVDGNGRVLDFDFNHNKLFNSSAEHAEARLVRRVFSLSQISDVYEEIRTQPIKRRGEYDMLSEVTIYTSLESCAQCAGMMALGNVKQVVYLQSDPGMYLVGNILHKLSPPMPKAPLPIPAQDVGFGQHKEALEKAFDNFVAGVGVTPFFEPGPANPNPNVDRVPSISSFLCTGDAWDVFETGSQEFDQLGTPQLPLKCPEEQSLDRDGKVVSDSLTNEEVLENARHFFNYAEANGRRGTPHRA